MKRFILPAILLVLILGFWASSDFQQIAAGVAIFLFGMMMLEDGFKLFSGGFLDQMLRAATKSLPRAVSFGVLSTAILQSSSLVSVITISFLSAGLINLLGGVGIIFGANLGTTTGAWLVAAFGMKLDLSALSLPMLAIGIVLVMQRGKYSRGAGLALAGIGFLFLGIHNMKEGFEAFRDQVDLSRLAMTGLAGLAVYSLIGALATVIMQSSHATVVLIITALASGQLTYDNALALAIGANIGTTITAILGALGANFQGRRLALAHLIFNLSTALVALVLIAPLRDLVDVMASAIGLADDNYTLKLAIFHSVFNLLGVALMIPVIQPLIRFLTRAIPEPVLDLSRPKYLSDAVEGFPSTIEPALRREVHHLYKNAEELIAHGLNLHRGQVFSSKDIAATVRASRKPIEFDLDARYEQRVKTLHAAIIEFTTRVGANDLSEAEIEKIYALRDVANRIVRAVKSIKHLRRNVTQFTTQPKGGVSKIYNDLRTEIARILAEINKLDQAPLEARSSLWLDQERIQVERDQAQTSEHIDALIRKGELDAITATSFINDSGYAYSAMRDLIEAARDLYIAPNTTLAEVERLIELDEEDVHEIAGTGS